MVEVQVKKEIAAGIEACWALFSKFGDLSWIDGDQQVEVIGEGVGMIRRLTMPGMEPFDEVLLAMDDAAHSYTYSIPKCAIIPFDNYVAEVMLSGDANRCEVRWTSSFDEGGMDAEQAKELIAANYRMMLDMAAQKLTA